MDEEALGSCTQLPQLCFFTSDQDSSGNSGMLGRVSMKHTRGEVFAMIQFRGESMRAEVLMENTPRNADRDMYDFCQHRKCLLAYTLASLNEQQGPKLEIEAPKIKSSIGAKQ